MAVFWDLGEREEEEEGWREERRRREEEEGGGMEGGGMEGWRGGGGECVDKGDGNEENDVRKEGYHKQTQFVAHAVKQEERKVSLLCKV